MTNPAPINTINGGFQSLRSGFLESLHIHPEKKALVVNGESFTYAALAAVAAEIYKSIGGKKKHERIAVYCSEGVFPYAAILAVTCYGACYVPVNRKFPAERNIELIRESGATLLLSDVSLKEYEKALSSINIVYCGNGVANTLNTDLTEKVRQDLAYILFTSGSSGKPKGVPVSKKNVAHFFSYFLSAYPFTAGDGFLQPYELTFDVSVFSMFMPWLVGACCYEVPQHGIRYLNIIDTLKKYPVTVSSMVPGVLNYLSAYLNEVHFPDLKYSFFSGDALQHDLALKWSKAIPNGEIHNFYGPTETTIVCMRYVWEEKKSAEESLHNIVPLGKCFPGMNALVLGENNQVIMNEAPGELCMSGPQVIAAYLGGSNTDAFFNHENAKWYKTGDVVSVNSNGDLLFHGRKDSQVKINGYRVELKEIEAKLKEISGADCCVLCTKDKRAMNSLTAIIADPAADLLKIKNELSVLLPEYMIPQRMEKTEQLPLNINGKTDRLQLIHWLNEQHLA